MVKSNNDYKDDKLSIFDFANIINFKQIDKLEFNNIYNIGYSPYLMNKLYSNIPDTVFYANIIITSFYGITYCWKTKTCLNLAIFWFSITDIII